MRQITCTLILFACCLVLVRCEKSPVDQTADTLMQGYYKGQKASAEANLRTLQTAVQQYRATNEKYPDSLTDVTDLINGQIDMSMYEYDPRSGTVTLKED